jgi:uncharacterized membrane protein
LAIWLFLGIDAYRFRGYIVWRTRVRLLQENVWTQGLDPSVEPVHGDRREELAVDSGQPTLKIDYEALGRRLRRISLPVLTIVLPAWIIRLTALSAIELPADAATGALPNPLVLVGGAGFYLLAMVITFRPRTWKGTPELSVVETAKWPEDRARSGRVPTCGHWLFRCRDRVEASFEIGHQVGGGFHAD